MNSPTTLVATAAPDATSINPRVVAGSWFATNNGFTHFGVIGHSSPCWLRIRRIVGFRHRRGPNRGNSRAPDSGEKGGQVCSLNGDGNLRVAKPRRDRRAGDPATCEWVSIPETLFCRKNIADHFGSPWFALSACRGGCLVGLSRKILPNPQRPSLPRAQLHPLRVASHCGRHTKSRRRWPTPPWRAALSG